MACAVYLQGKDTLQGFCFRVFHEVQFQGPFMKHKMLSGNIFALVSEFH